jgi:hypothetical protein
MGGKRTRKRGIQEKRDLIQQCYDIRTIISPLTQPILFDRVLVEIMMPQPQWTHRTGTIHAVRVQRRDKRRAFALRLKVQTERKRWITVSWRAGILAEFPTAKLQACPIRVALRQCIRRQVCTFRRSSSSQSTLSCRMCLQCDPSTVYHVDHEEPTFASLVLLFLAEDRNAADCPDAADIQYGRNGRRTFPPECTQFARRWRKFHQEHAVLRILCRSCNLHRKRTTD